MDETMNTASESTISQESETQQEVNEAIDPETAPQVGGNAEGAAVSGSDVSGTAQKSNAENRAPFLEIRYNHEKRGLTKEEAASLAQKGIYYEGAYNALERVATLKGQSVESFLKGIEAAEDEAYREHLIDKFGDDEETIGQMLEIYNLNKEKTLNNASMSRKQAAQAAEQSTNARIAEEFQGMKAEFPELTEFSALPEAVKRAALNGMPLEYAYLKHGYSEQRRINAARAAQSAAAEKSTGSMGTDDSDNTQYGVQFLNALWRR